jgi:hypothetical protein
MSAWVINVFGSREVNEAFLLLTLGPLPVWIGLVLFPRERWTRVLMSPFVVPPILGLAYCYLLWKVRELGFPTAPTGEARSVRAFVAHPLIFLLLWAHLQMANVFVATVLLQDAARNKLSVRLELALCWIFAPIAVLLYTIRRFLRLYVLPR